MNHTHSALSLILLHQKIHFFAAKMDALQRQSLRLTLWQLGYLLKSNLNSVGQVMLIVKMALQVKPAPQGCNKQDKLQKR